MVERDKIGRFYQIYFELNKCTNCHKKIDRRAMRCRFCRNRYNHPKNGKGTIDKKGYKWITINGKQVRESHYIWCSDPYNLSFIPEGFVIHHLNGNKLNNQAENLILLSRDYHTKIHRAINKTDDSYKQDPEYKKNMSKIITQWWAERKAQGV